MNVSLFFDHVTQDSSTFFFFFTAVYHIGISPVPAGSPSRGGDVAVYVSDINQPSLPTPFLIFIFLYSVLVSVSVFMVFSTVFHFINSSDNPPLSHSVLPILFLLCWSFSTTYISLCESLLQP